MKIESGFTDVSLGRVYGPESTLGFLFGDGFTYCTLELPWKNNEVSVSCIPEGVYQCEWINSPNLGWCYAVNNVYGRTVIRIHSGNYTSQIEGCILVGASHADINGDGKLDVTSSRNTLDALYSKLGNTFTLQIC